ncbi:hypothetical protein SASPL_146885 [Salvia splendens]|uniref:GRF-type domain-containing protein n=1 Tax=Salvia splendens TaxID=180675 RepID=A0A8X8WDH4_SALSN|nr:hypothetical protein SASPL_146885 [Salvia splendens]
MNDCLQPITKHNMQQGVYLLLCSCGNGMMDLRCAGRTARHAGRYYYKCPVNGDHPGSFKWFDEHPNLEEVLTAGLSSNMSSPSRYQEAISTVANYHDLRCQCEMQMIPDCKSIPTPESLPPFSDPCFGVAMQKGKHPCVLYGEEVNRCLECTYRDMPMLESVRASWSSSYPESSDESVSE